MVLFHLVSSENNTEWCDYFWIKVCIDVAMKIYFYYENIGTFKNVCPNFDYPLHLYLKKYWDAFFTKLAKETLLT